MTLILVTGSLVLLFLLVLISFIQIHFRYERKGENDHLTIGITWLRYLSFSVPVSLVDLRGGFKRDPTLKARAGAVRAKISLSAMLSPMVRNLARLHRLLKYASARTRVKKLEWSSEFGLGDAASTGVAAGLAWSLKSTLLTAVSACAHLETVPRIRVRPNFQKPLFHTLFDCIFEIRIGHIMIAGLKAIRPG